MNIIVIDCEALELSINYYILAAVTGKCCVDAGNRGSGN